VPAPVLAVRPLSAAVRVTTASRPMITHPPTLGHANENGLDPVIRVPRVNESYELGAITA
jgi:hypothetical protein